MADKDEETALVIAALDGCQTARGELYEQYAGLVRALCVDATGRLQDADDLAQEVFLRAFKQLDKLRDTSKFGAWLLGISRMVIKEWQRARRRDSRTRDRESSSDGLPMESVDASDEFALVCRLISRLDEDERLALHLFYLQEYPADAARAVMGLSRSGFYRLLERAKARIAGQLKSTMGTGHEPLDR